MLRCPFARSVTAIFLFCLIVPVYLFSQTELAHVSGRVTDPSGAIVVDTEVEVKNVDTNLSTTVSTNQDGLYTFPPLRPGRYILTARKAGFKTVTVTQFVLNAQDLATRNFILQIGSASEIVTVTADTLNVNTTDATVSTVVDRQFADNLPLNGRSFQSLIEMTPGVQLTSTANTADTGQFSVNGQRAASNYWMVDGVSANTGISGAAAGGTNNGAGNGYGGAVGATTLFGGTNSLVSVDAMQEFRIETSTFAPDTGRTPGGQISIVTRSGTNQFHGAAFDYFRNDVLDANNWFNGINFFNPSPLPKAEERQNDFGGTFGGPILKDRTFFFFSYEGLRLRLPTTTLTQVPDASFTPGTTDSRQNALPALQPYLNAFPLPNPTSPELPCQVSVDPSCPTSGPYSGLSGAAAFNASYSNPGSLDAYSLRIDHKLNDKITLFGRYNYSPSSLAQRANGYQSLNSISFELQTIQTATLGVTWILSPTISEDFRFNYSRVNGSDDTKEDTFGGAVPVTPLLPSGFTTQNSNFGFDIYTLADGEVNVGFGTHSLQRQVALVDNLAVQMGKHRLAFGVDFRRLTPQLDNAKYFEIPLFSGVATAEVGNPDGGDFVYTSNGAHLLLRNLGLFAQDTWQVLPRLTMTYGLRWDVDFAPATVGGPPFPSLINYNLNDLSQLGYAPPGTAPFKTRYGNFAPRIGMAYQLFQKNGAPTTVLRGGFGVYYDLVTSEVGNQFQNGYPWVAYEFYTGVTFPSAPPPPAIQAPSLANPGFLQGYDPNIRLPYTLEWNVAWQQALGKQQTLTVSYIGSQGKRLLQTAYIIAPNNPSLTGAFLTGNGGFSSYNALQAQFQRHLSAGLQVLASYTWAHSIDTGSSGSFYSPATLPGSDPNQNRGDSDFDVRNALTAGVTYDIPTLNLNRLTHVVLGGWSLQNIIQAHSALPLSVIDGLLQQINNQGASIRADLIPGIPLYLYGSQYPGGKILNNTPNEGGPGCFGPFCPPPIGANGNALRQGDSGRNEFRGYPLAQWDFAVHRDFPIHESLKLQFRAEMFNVVNHPNFGPPDGDIIDNTFGYATQMFGQYLASLNPLYQIGGPRSIQFALKFLF